MGGVGQAKLSKIVFLSGQISPKFIGYATVQIADVLQANFVTKHHIVAKIADTWLFFAQKQQLFCYYTLKRNSTTSPSFRT